MNSMENKKMLDGLYKESNKTQMALHVREHTSHTWTLIAWPDNARLLSNLRPC
jgi:hypothetical protein